MATSKIQAFRWCAETGFLWSSKRFQKTGLHSDGIKGRLFSSSTRKLNQFAAKNHWTYKWHMVNNQHKCRAFTAGNCSVLNQKNSWSWKDTRFGGLMLDLGVVLEHYSRNQQKDFGRDLAEYLNAWKSSGKRGVWVRVPLEYSWTLSALHLSGFTCHHAKSDYIMMTKWLPDTEENKIPNFSFHTVGVSGLVLNEEKCEALVVQDKGKITKWKFPGGFAEPHEDIGDTAVREIREETGVESEFKSLLTFRQQHGMAFNLSDLYFICRLSPLTFDITLCETEIAKCEWLPLEYLLHSDDSTPLTKRVTALVMRGMEKGFSEVDIVPETMKSWVRPYDRTFKVFHRPIDK